MKICRARLQLVFTFNNRFSSTGCAVQQSVRYIIFHLQQVTCLLPSTQAGSHAGSKVYIWNVFGRDLLSIDPTCSHFKLFVLWFYNVQMKQWTPERRQGYQSSAPKRHSYLIDDHVRSASSKMPVAGISSVLQLSGLCPSSLPSDASFTKKSWPIPLSSC